MDKISDFNNGFIEELKARINIVDVIGRFVHLQKKGRDYWACCPFHHEKTASFQIREDQQYFKCFGCQKGGDVITFIMEHERITYPEALEYLANLAGMKLPENKAFSHFKKDKELIEKIHNANSEAAKFYHKNLVSGDNPALAYLAARGVDKKTIIRFGLGYSRNQSELPIYLHNKGYDNTTLKSAGLIYMDSRGEAVDFFWGRLIVPIIDANGNVVGFGGRVLEKTDFAKYKNTSKTPAFDKSKTLFALNLYKKLAQQEKINYMIIVEGYMDVISLYIAGIKNVVATMGTSLTIEQCRMIKRYTDIVVVSFDGDAAGQKATIRSLDMLKEAGLEVRVVVLPEGEDPDDTVRKRGKDFYLSLADNALPLMDYKIKITEEKYDMSSTDGKTKFAHEAIDYLKKASAVEKELYGGIIAGKASLEKETVLKLAESGETDRILTTSPITTRTTGSVQTTKDKPDTIAERFILSALFNYEQYAEISAMDEDYFDDNFYKQVFLYLKKCVDTGSIARLGDLFNAEDGGTEKVMEIINEYETTPIDKRSVTYNRYLIKLQQKAFTKKRTRAISMLAEAKTPEEKEKIKNEILTLTKTHQLITKY